MNHAVIAKINTLGRVGHIISKICRVVLAIGAAVCLLGALVMCLVPRDTLAIRLTTTTSASIQLGQGLDLFHHFGLHVDRGSISIGQNTYPILFGDGDMPATVEHVFYLSDVKWILLAGLVACAALYVAFYFAGKLCAYFRDCQTPFSQESSAGLIRLAWSLVPVCILTSLAESSVHSLATGALRLTMRINPTNILLILCLFLLSYIFKYGAALQAEADETL